MTVDPDEKQDDRFLDGLAGMRTYDVSRRRSRRLRRRCHAVLQAEPPPTRLAMVDGALFRRIIGPALGGAWCLAYLAEIVRRAAAVYFGTQ